MPPITRRGLLIGGLAVAGSTGLNACSNGSTPSTRVFGTPTPVAPGPGQRVVTARLTAQATRLDLGGVLVDTWAYGDTAPGASDPRHRG